MNEHGGEIYNIENRVIDFSININPLGMPQEVMEVGVDAVELSAVYPDTNCSELKIALAEKYMLNSENIVCGNGAGELIFAICQGIKPKKVLITAPSFSEYKRAAMAVEAEIIEYPLYEKNSFMPEKDIIAAIKEVDLAFLCNPHNPTGVLWKNCRTMVKSCPDTTIVIDECFMDFVDVPETMSTYVDKYKNLVVLNAFTKIYAMAGVRLGFCLCNKNIADKIKAVLQPWNVSLIAQKMGVEALKCEDFVERTINYVNTERFRLETALKDLGIKFFKGSANFILIYSEIDLYNELLEHNILIRDCSNFDNLGKGYYRIAIGSEENNSKLIYALRQIIDSL